MRALCVGDLHAGAGSDLGRAPGDRLAEQSEVWTKALWLARENECDLVLQAGDIFHRAKPSPDEILAVERPLIEHRAAGGCPVYGVVGNHEVSGASGTVPEAFDLAGLWHLYGTPGIADTPLGVSIAFLPWSPVSRIVASQDGDDRDRINEQAAELLLRTAQGLRDKIEGPAVLLCHWSISGSALPNGLPVEQLREPVLEISELEALGFDAVVAGHIHAPQILTPPTGPTTPGPIFYVGSPMPLNFGEAETGHGVYVLEIKNRMADVRFLPIESRPLVTLDFHDDAMALEPPYEIAEALVMDAVVKARVRLTAEEARRFDAAAFKRAIYEAGAEKVWAVQLEIEKPERARVEGISEELDELAALDAYMDANAINGDQARELRERTERYLGLVRA
jgi:DNA repair exonuclease SbcCD nuclease subunit